MGMHGAWHLYRNGERWRRPGTQARVILETDDGTVAV
jgi:endonuclease-8